MLNAAILSALGLTLAISAPAAAAWTSPAPDVVLYTLPALQAPLQTVARQFTARAHVAVHIFVAAPDGLFGLMRHHARADVVVADAATLHRMTAAGLVRGTAHALGNNPYVLVASTLAPPLGRTAEALAASYPIVLPDPTTAASFDGVLVLRAALPTSAPISRGVADTPAVLATVHEDPAVLGLVSQTEAHASGLVTAARLPVPPAEILAALVTGGQSGSAGALLAALTAAEGQAALHAAGLEP